MLAQHCDRVQTLPVISHSTNNRVTPSSKIHEFRGKQVNEKGMLTWTLVSFAILYCTILFSLSISGSRVLITCTRWPSLFYFAHFWGVTFALAMSLLAKQRLCFNPSLLCNAYAAARQQDYPTFVLISRLACLASDARISNAPVAASWHAARSWRG